MGKKWFKWLVGRFTEISMKHTPKIVNVFVSRRGSSMCKHVGFAGTESVVTGLLSREPEPWFFGSFNAVAVTSYRWQHVG